MQASMLDPGPLGEPGVKPEQTCQGADRTPL